MLLANTLAPWLPFTPGFSAFNFELAIPMTLLAAVIERPFLTAGGLGRWTLARSIQANLCSTLIGVLTVLPATALAYTIGPFVWPIAVTLSVLVERIFLTRTGPGDDRVLRLGWVVGGNLVSSPVLWIIPFAVFAIQDASPNVRSALAPHKGWLRLSTVGASGIAILSACIMPFLADSQPRARETATTATAGTGLTQTSAP